MRRVLHRWVASGLMLIGLVATSHGQDFPFGDDSGVAPVVAGEALTLEVSEPSLEEQLEAMAKRVKSLEEGSQKRTAADTGKKAADARKPTVKWSAELQADAYSFSQDANNKATLGDIENGADFRRARVAMLGDYGPFDYRLEMDYAQSARPSFLDVYTSLNDLPGIGRIRAGHFFEPFLLDRLTSNRYTTFMERTTVDQAFAPSRNLGVAAANTFAEEQGTWSLGMFRTDSDNFGDDIGDNFNNSITSRVTWMPTCACEGRQYTHLGLGYSFRDANNGVARFRAEPEAREGAASTNVPFFVDTGDVPAHFFQLIGLESAWVNGPLSLQAEYVLVPVNPIGQETQYLQGAYGTVSYFLTGEYRPWRRDSASFDRVIPNRDFLKYQRDAEDQCVEFGPGAWEVAARLSYLDLNSQTISGGELTDVTAGLNWYLSPYVRFTSNYVHAFLNNPVRGRSGTDVYAMRIQFDF